MRQMHLSFVNHGHLYITVTYRIDKWMFILAEIDSFLTWPNPAKFAVFRIHGHQVALALFSRKVQDVFTLQLFPWAFCERQLLALAII
jgi:hypothetical protein